MKTDKIVIDVCQKFINRSEAGQLKYNTTLKDNTTDNYLQHLQEELMDATNYLETLLQTKADITQLVNDEPNDWELGKKIRGIYGRWRVVCYSGGIDRTKTIYLAKNIPNKRKHNKLIT